MNKNYSFRSLIKKVAVQAGLGVLLLGALNTEVSAQSYCTSTNTSTSSYYITNVTTSGGITNITNTGTGFGASGYSDYTAMTAVVIPGGSFTVNAAGGPSSSYTYMWAIWCDWNHDFDFDDPGETMYTYGSTYINAIAATFTIPPTATGSTRMRIRGTYISPTPLACGSNNYAETEDYTLILPPNNNASARTLISPNSDPFCSNSSKEVSVSIINKGGNALSSANINWSVDGVTQTPTTLPTTLTYYNDSAVVTLGNVFFQNTTPKVIKVWTSMPNGMMDSNTSDDTMSKSVAASLQGVDVKLVPNDTIICEGSSITLDAGTHPLNPIYIWENGDLTQTRTVSTSGVYSVKVQNNIGCYDRDTVVVTVHPDPVVNSIAIIDNGDGSFTFNAIGAQNVANYTWNFGDNSAPVSGSGTPTQQIHSFACGEYTVTLDLSNDCRDIQAHRLIKIDCPTGIDNISALQKEISVFPNPSTTSVTIANKSHIKMKEISIVNLMGQSVYKNEKVNAEQFDINTASFAAGIYNVMINTDKGTVTKKLEIIR